jgi:hypothetical protein
MSFRTRPIMAQHRSAIKNHQSQNSPTLVASTNPTNRLVKRRFSTLSKRGLAHAARATVPTLFTLAFASVAHAQGTMDFSGAQTLMGTFNNRLAYVAISRASDDARVYTNNVETLGERLASEITKSAAVDFKQNRSMPEIELEGMGIAL